MPKPRGLYYYDPNQEIGPNVIEKETLHLCYYRVYRHGLNLEFFGKWSNEKKKFIVQADSIKIIEENQ